MIKTKLFLLFFTLGGLSFAALGSWQTWTMWRELETAVETTGVVQSAEVRKERGTRNGRNITYFIPVVKYEYTIGGRTYHSDDLYPGALLFHTPADQSRARAETIVRRYSAGTRIRVWSLPHDPATSFLIRERRVMDSLGALIGGMLAAAGAGFSLALVAKPGPRFAAACIVFVTCQGLTWLLWQAFLTAPQAELDGSLLLTKWLMVAYVVIGWAGLIGNAPQRLEKVRSATFTSLFVGTFVMSLSTFIFVPLTVFMPDWEAVRAMPWVGVAAAVLGLLGWLSGVVTLTKPSLRHRGSGD